MPIEFACTHCTKRVRVPDGSEGKKCKCPECQTILNVPDAEIEAFEIKLEVPCPQCKFVLVCDPKLEGTRGLCPNCKLIFTIAPPGSTKYVKSVANIQMTFAFQCPHCKQLFEGKQGMEGRKGKCIHCKEVFEIKKFVEPVSQLPSSLAITNQTMAPQPTHTQSITPSTRTTPVPKAVPVLPKKQVPIAKPTAKPIAPSNDVDWLGSLPQSATYSAASNSASPINPYAASSNVASYGGQAGHAVAGSAESVRRLYLSHESAIKGFGLLYGIASGFYILAATAAAVLSVFAFSAGNGVVPGVFVLIYLAVYFVLGILAALVSSGLYKLSDVGKIGGSIFAVLGLCAIPFGTILGGYLLFLLLSEKGNFVFSKNYRTIVKQTPQLRCTTPLFIWIILALCILLLLFGVLLVLFGARNLPQTP